MWRAMWRSGAALGLTVIAAGAGCATVPPGWGGVVLSRWGLRQEALREGDAFIGPLSKVDLYDLRVQTRTEDLAAVAADGAPLRARASLVAFHLDPDELVALDHEVGLHYYAAVVRPTVMAEVRRVLAGFRSDELDSAGIRRAEALVTARVARALRPYHIIADSLDMRNLVVNYTREIYGVIVGSAVLEQQVLAVPQRLALVRQRADLMRQAARARAAELELVQPTLSPQILNDAGTRAFGHLLAAPGTTVVHGGGSTVLEVP
jgi:hypothetical protein